MSSVNSKKNKCQFCVAYFPDKTSFVEHSENCFARISAFLARDGAIKFACMVCRDVFSTPAQLGEHERMHRLPGGFNCTICSAAFLSEKDRVEHLETDHKIFECLRCDDEKLISTDAAYIQHCEQQHNSQSGYARCLACGATFEEKSHLRFHTETECGYLHGWTCIECAAIFTTEEDLSEHCAGHSTCEIKTEKDDIDFQFEHVSTECPGSSIEDSDVHGDSRGIEESLFVDDIQWKDEAMVDVKSEDCGAEETMETEENESDDSNESGDESEEESESSDESVNKKPEKSRLVENEYECEFCKKRYTYESSLKRHQVQIHDVGSKRRRRTFKKIMKKKGRKVDAELVCEKCGFKTHLKEELFSHFESQCGSKIVNQCVICNESFKTRHRFAYHTKTHTGADLTCSECNASFANYRRFANHVRSHDKTKCKFCSKEFIVASRLRNHMRTHTQENSLQCLGCYEQFDNTTKLKIHRRERPETCALAPFVENDTTEGRVNFLNVKIKRDPEKHKCDKCDKCFPSEKKLVKHRHEEHRLKCERCEFTTISSSDLTLHLKSQCGREPYFRCLVCNATFLKEHKFDSHKKTHSVFECTICIDTSFSSYREFSHHMRSHESDRFQCTICNRKYRQELRLQRHMAKHFAVKTYKCHGCGEGFDNMVALRKHRSQSTSCKRTVYSRVDTTGITPTNDVSGKWLECSICKDKFKTTESLETHKTVHGDDGSKKFKCMDCPTFFASKDERVHHIKETHAEILECADCIKFCTTRGKFNVHIKYDHSNLPRPKANLRHTCAKCGMSFVSKQFRIDHERSNCGKDPLYKCEICDKALTNKYTLRQHISLMHQDNAKNFVCTYCGKGYRTKYALNTHLVYHTGEKRYRCTICDKRFFDRASLLTHEPTHTGIKPYMCQCGDRFSCISNLQSHRRARKTTCGLLPLVTKKFPTFDADPVTNS